MSEHFCDSSERGKMPPGFGDKVKAKAAEREEREAAERRLETPREPCRWFPTATDSPSGCCPVCGHAGLAHPGPYTGPGKACAVCQIVITQNEMSQALAEAQALIQAMIERIP